MTRTDRILLAVVGLTFLVAGAAKVVDPAAFAISVARLRIVPMALVGPVAILVPWIEIVAAAALALPDFRRPALQLLLGMLSLFSVVLAAGLLRGATACGCFGSSDLFLNRPEVAAGRNAILIAMAVALLVRSPAATSRSSPASPASGTDR